MLRTDIEAGRVAAAMRIPFGARHDQIALITQDHAREILMARRTEITQATQCWIAGGESAYENGYKAVNLANTYSQVDGRTREKIGIWKMYLHHLALIGADRRDELEWCTQANSVLQVSHFCHNGKFFNPRHLLAEESSKNKTRNPCQGHEIVEYNGLGAMRYHPCTHGGERNAYRRCILPARRIGEPGSYTNGFRLWILVHR
jgi:hypothetical protein